MVAHSTNLNRDSAHFTDNATNVLEDMGEIVIRHDHACTLYMEDEMDVNLD